LGQDNREGSGTGSSGIFGLFPKTTRFRKAVSQLIHSMKPKKRVHVSKWVVGLSVFAKVVLVDLEVWMHGCMDAWMRGCMDVGGCSSRDRPAPFLICCFQNSFSLTSPPENHLNPTH